MYPQKRISFIIDIISKPMRYCLLFSNNSNNNTIFCSFTSLKTVELLAEVAVLEEEVVRLEERLVNFRQGLYQEAVFISSSKKTKEIVPDTDSDGGCSQSSKTIEQLKLPADLPTCQSLVSMKPLVSVRYSLDAELSGPSSNQSANGKRRLNKQNTSLNSSEDRRGKENQWITNFSRNQKQSPVKKVLKTQVTVSEDQHADAEVNDFVHF